jgi:hypothetical protein
MDRLSCGFLALGATLALATACSATRSIERPPGGEEISAGMARLEPGIRVAAMWKDGRFYPGTVAGVLEDRRYEIAFDDGDRWTVTASAAMPMSAPGDLRSGASVLAMWRNGSMYPGRVVELSAGGATIAWDDGTEPTFVNEHLIAPFP